MPAGLLADALARVDEHDREVGGRGARDHVARVLLVARGVGDDELAPGGLEVPIGDVDRDALLALGAQAVGQQSEVDVAVAAALGGLHDVLELILEDRLGVVQQAADQRRLAVVDRSGGGEPQQLAGAGSARRPLPSWRLRGTLEIALALAVFHRGLGHPVVGACLAALGDPGGRDLGDDLLQRRGLGATAPVQVMSPTVR